MSSSQQLLLQWYAWNRPCYDFGSVGRPYLICLRQFFLFITGSIWRTKLFSFQWSAFQRASQIKKKKRKYAVKLLKSPENVTFNWIGIRQPGVTRRKGLSWANNLTEMQPHASNPSRVLSHDYQTPCLDMPY